ncbi:hypothetical protein T07_1582, partial [Trichinella nelsoni]
LEKIRRNSCTNIHQMELCSSAYFISFLIAHTKITSFVNVFCHISTNTLLWNVRLVSNKWPLKLPCSYLNTQESRHTGTPLKWNKGDFFAIIMRYSLTFCTLVQYFLVLSNLIFLHFRSISNKFKKVVSLWFQIRFWKVLRHINSYVSNKWLLKLPCVYLNTQESSRTETLFKRIQDG